MKNKKAFTLAELLITLGIIGIVASMTIPSILTNKEKQENLTKLKKAYSTFNQALTQLTNDYSCLNNLQCTDLFTDTTTNTSLGDEIVKYFKVIKNCKTSAGCFPSAFNTGYDGSGGNGNFDSLGFYGFIVADGMSFLIQNRQENCLSGPFSTGVTGNLSQVCGDVYIDINGPDHKPNYFGKDIFHFYISNGKGAILYPVGGPDDNGNEGDGYWKNGDGSVHSCGIGNPYGESCAGRIIDEGWQINY